jgi:hypothetical protein
MLSKRALLISVMDAKAEMIRTMQQVNALEREKELGTVFEREIEAELTKLKNEAISFARLVCVHDLKLDPVAIVDGFPTLSMVDESRFMACLDRLAWPYQHVTSYLNYYAVLNV